MQQISKELLFKVCRFYSEKLTEKFLWCPVTPATIVSMKRELKEIQHDMARREPSVAWEIPVLLEVEGQNVFIGPDLAACGNIEFV
jgi:hypothetical protein